ncbi:response regulator [Robbsia andropogonis]|nr:response regulator [Robbsia andropogonis]
MMAMGNASKNVSPTWYRRAPVGFEEAEPRARAARKLRVLVVDDNTDAAAALSFLVECWGHDVRLAYDGDQAMRMASGYSPDAVLLDIGLPGMSGYDVAASLRASETQVQSSCDALRAVQTQRTVQEMSDQVNAAASSQARARHGRQAAQLTNDAEQAPPRALLVAVTGYGLPEDIAKARAAGFDFHVTKPSNTALLESLLARYAGRFDGLSQLAEGRGDCQEEGRVTGPMMPTEALAALSSV